MGTAAPTIRALLRARLALVATVGLGAFAGLAGFTFTYAKGGAYLTNDPAACANCHVMREQFEGWQRGSHHAVATCNDCHAPHALLPKLAVKAINGFNHAYPVATPASAGSCRCGCAADSRVCFCVIRASLA